MRIIRLAQQPVEADPTPPGQCPRCGTDAWHKWGRPKLRKIVDVNVTHVTTQRYRCKHCGKTVTARPKGVGRAGRSHSFMALLGVLYALGLSHRGIETALGLFGHSVDHVSSWRDIQRLGKAVKRRLPEGKARVVGVDETWVKIKDRSRPVGVVIDVGGRVLSIELTGPEFDYESWFESMADELGVEVVVTDDSTDYSIPTGRGSVIRQQCLVHMKRTLGRAIGRLDENIRNQYGNLLDQITETVRELPPDGADRLFRWSQDRRLPSELRRLAIHLLERWRQMTVHQRRSGVPNSTNWVEGRFGRIKPRYRTTRGLKTESGAVNFMAVVCDVLA